MRKLQSENRKVSTNKKKQSNLDPIKQLAGSLKQYAKKGKSIEQIMAEEEKAIEQSFIEREIRFLQQNKRR